MQKSDEDIGKTYESTGITPDFEIGRPEEEKREFQGYSVKAILENMPKDPVLRAAVEMPAHN